MKSLLRKQIRTHIYKYLTFNLPLLLRSDVKSARVDNTQLKYLVDHIRVNMRLTDHQHLCFTMLKVRRLPYNFIKSHARTRARTHVHMHLHTTPLARKHASHACIHACMHACIHACMHACTHACSLTSALCAPVSLPPRRTLMRRRKT